MAFNNWILNQTPASGGESLYLLKEMLKSAGWTVQGWGDGTSFSNNTGGTDGITIGSSGAGGFNNSGAWIRIENPDGCEICFQRTATDERNVTITYSASAGFSTGGGSFTLPTATDGQTALSDTTLFGAGGSYYLQGGADDANGYGFWIGGYNSGASIKFGFVMEPLLQTDALDTDPGKQNLLLSATWSSGSFNADSATFDVGYQRAKGWLKDSWVSFAGMSIYSTGDQRTFPSFITGNPYSTKDDRVPILYAKPAIALPVTFPYGYKGMGRLMQWEGTYRSTADTKQSKTRIVFGEISLPWDGITTPSV